MGNIGIQNLVTALSRVGASAVAQVGPDATAGLVPILGLQLTTADFAGGWAVFDAGAFGSDAPPTVAPIASNTTDTLAFAADVLPSAPAEGANVWLYQVGTFNVTVTAPENVAEWGGQPVAAADASGIPGVRNAYAQGDPAAAAPSQAVQVAGSDGTDLRVLATDSLGRQEVLTSPVASGLSDASGMTDATAGTSTVAISGGLVTRYLFIQNVSSTSGDNLWVNFVAAATEGSGSILVGPGAALVFEDSTVTGQSVNVISNVASLPYTIKYA